MATTATHLHLATRAANAPDALREFWLKRAALYSDLDRLNECEQIRQWHGLPRLATTTKELATPLAHLPAVTWGRTEPAGVARFNLCGEMCWRDDPAELAQRAEGAREVHVEIDTAGGSGWFALEFCARLKATGAKIVTTARHAFSAGAIVLQAGDVRRIRRDGAMMIHGPQIAIIGGADELEATAAKLRSEQEADIELFTAATGKPRATIESWLSTDTYFSPDEAIANNLADCLVD